jgi:hypothetical protein
MHRRKKCRLDFFSAGMAYHVKRSAALRSRALAPERGRDCAWLAADDLKACNR